MAVFFIVLLQEIRISFKKSSKILANSLFFAIFTSIFFILSQKSQENSQFYLMITIWLILVSCLVFSSIDFLKNDFDDGTIEQSILAIDNFENFILAKMLANWINYALPVIILAIFVLPESENFSIKQSFLILTLATIIINFICCLAGSLSSLGNSSPLISIIALPLLIPVILVANSALTYDFDAGFKILSGLLLLIAPISIFASAKIIKISSE